MWPFSCFRSSRSTPDLQTVVYDRIARVFNKSGATRAAALDISKTFGRVWHVGLGRIRRVWHASQTSVSWSVRSDIWPYFIFSQQKTASFGCEWEDFTRISRQCWSSSNRPDNAICNIAINAGDTTLHSKCDQASDLWQQLELASELESDLRDTVVWGKKWPVDFKAWKTQLVSTDRSNITGAVDVKMYGSALEEKSAFKMLGLNPSSKLNWSSYIISIAKTASRKIGHFICSMKFLSPEVALYLYKSTIRPCMKYCCHVWAGLSSCCLELLDKLQNGYVGLLVLHLLLPLNPWLIVEMYPP